MPTPTTPERLDRRPPQARRTGGFTLVELLVVIGIIALLIGILLPTLNAARERARTVKCLAQMRQLSNAALMYANDNRGWFESADTDGPIWPGTPIHDDGTPIPGWVGWVDGGNSVEALQNGTLWSYLKTAAVYRCPSDTVDSRVRSYSVNLYLNAWDVAAPGNWVLIQYRVTKRSRVPDAGNCIEFVEEQDTRNTGGLGAAGQAGQQWNWGGWYEFPAAVVPLSEPTPTADGSWIDTTVSWHQKGANFTFVDGHAEHWTWSDRRTVNYLKDDPTWPSPLYSTPGNTDLTRIQQHMVTWQRQQ